MCVCHTRQRTEGGVKKSRSTNEAVVNLGDVRCKNVKRPDCLCPPQEAVSSCWRCHQKKTGQIRGVKGRRLPQREVSASARSRLGSPSHLQPGPWNQHRCFHQVGTVPCREPAVAIAAARSCWDAASAKLAKRSAEQRVHHRIPTMPSGL